MLNDLAYAIKVVSLNRTVSTEYVSPFIDPLFHHFSYLVYNTQRPLTCWLANASLFAHTFWMQKKTQISRSTLKKATFHLINHSDFERVPTGGRVLDFIAFMPWALQKFTH